MTMQTRVTTPKTAKRPAPPFECIALLLQGGGALGAYQGGVYQALAESDIHPNWIAGMSIGALNAAIIAGNPPERRVLRLREFWEQITRNFFAGWTQSAQKFVTNCDAAMRAHDQFSIGMALATGAPGFFTPRGNVPWLMPDGAAEATSFYDTSPLKNTLERLIDFDRINSEARDVRLSVGAVNVRSGKFIYFDTTTHTIGPEHVMASCALPPGFPAIEIEGELYWDGGFVSNTPLQWLTENLRHVDTLVFQVDLWSAGGDLPHTMTEVITRQKDIQYSSRTRDQTTNFKRAQKMRHAVADLLDKLPEEFKNLPEAKLLATRADRSAYNLIHLIYHTQKYEGVSKDCEFSRLSMEDHWRSGYNDTLRTLSHSEILVPHATHSDVFTFDIANA